MCLKSLPVSEQKKNYKLVVERMNAIEKLQNRIHFNNLSHHYKGPTANVSLNNFIDAAILFDEIKSSRIELEDEKRNPMDFESKLSNIRIGGKKSDKQDSPINNITNLYNAKDYVIKFFEDCSTMMHNARYDATHGKGLKTFTPKQMLRRLSIALVLTNLKTC